MNKCHYIALSLLICLPRPARGAEVSSPALSFQQHVSRHPEVVHIGMLTLVGAVQGHSYRHARWGALLGLCAALLDQLSIHFGLSSHHYLSYGILGASTLSTLPLPYHAGEAVGAAVGILIPAGVVSPDKIQAPLIGAVTAYYVGGQDYGPTLAAIGLAGGVIDEIVVSSGLSGVRLFATCFESMALSRIFLPRVHKLAGKVPVLGQVYQRLSGAIAVPSSAIGVPIFATLLIRSSGDQKWSALELNDAITNTTSAVIGKKRFEEIRERQFLILFATKVLTLHLDQKIVDIQGEFFRIFESLSVVTNENWNQFVGTTQLFLVYVIPHLSHSLASSYVTDSFDHLMSREFEAGLRSKYLQGEMPLKLSQNNETEALLDHMTEHMETVSSDGFSLLSGSVSTAINGVYSIGFLSSHQSLDLGVFLFLYNKGTERVTLYLNEKEWSHSEKLYQVQTQITNLEKEFRKNAELIIEGDNTALITSKLNHAIEERIRLERRERLWGLASRGWFSSLHFLNFLFTNFVIASKIKEGELPFKDRNLVAMKSGDISQLLSWEGNHATTVVQVKKATTALDKLLAAMNEQGSFCHKSKTVYVRDAVPSLHFTDFEVGVEDRILLRIPDLKLDKGTYVLTGKSGSGKSSLLSKIKGIVYNGVCSTGTLTFTTPSGEPPRIVSASQSDYLVPGATLLELLWDKDLSDASSDEKRAITDRALDFLYEIEFDRFQRAG